MGFGHIPVLVEEVMTFLRCEPGRTYVDATLGGGGHASEILKRTAPDGVVIGMEWDEEALSEARNRLMPFGDRVKIFRENFIHLPENPSMGFCSIWDFLRSRSKKRKGDSVLKERVPWI
jgi:16S rRNA (cytosine1402-N4)-methyltransferase